MSATHATQWHQRLLLRLAMFCLYATTAVASDHADPIDLLGHKALEPGLTGSIRVPRSCGRTPRRFSRASTDPAANQPIR